MLPAWRKRAPLAALEYPQPSSGVGLGNSGARCWRRNQLDAQDPAARPRHVELLLEPLSPRSARPWKRGTDAAAAYGDRNLRKDHHSRDGAGKVARANPVPLYR